MQVQAVSVADAVGDALRARLLAGHYTGGQLLRDTERMLMLNVIDNQWKDHLLSMDHLKEGIGLRGYGQRDPLVEYKKESYDLFTAMKDRIEDEMVRLVMRLPPSV
mgnify:CR=1 FL=1